MRIVAPEQGEWVDIDKKFEIQCCDCGLVHKWELRVKDNKVQLRGWRKNKKGVEGVLEDYTDWLFDNGYVDDDVWSEKPTATERYLNERNV